MSSLEPTTPAAPTEDVVRGALFSLIVLPVGIAAWLLLWSVGFIASIVAFGVAVAAVWLYRLGTRGRISTAGAIVVTGVTVVTLLLAFFAGMVLDALNAIVDQTGMTWSEVIVLPEFWDFVGVAIPAAFGDYALNFVIAIGFGVLGCFTVLRSAFAQGRQGASPAETPTEDGTASESPAAEQPQSDSADEGLRDQ